MTESLPRTLWSLVAPHEVVLYVAKQRPHLFKIDFRRRMIPDIIIATDRRLIHVHRNSIIKSAFGVYGYVDYMYEDIANVRVDKGFQ